MDAEELAQRDDLARRTQTADLGNVDADEISRSLMRGTYSCCVLNSSPMASGVLVCWRSKRK
jgi:hypothetical protein